MKKECLTAYQFLLLYSALSIYKENSFFIYNKELEQKLAKFHDVEAFNILFSNIELKQTNKIFSLNLDEAFDLAYNKGLLIEIPLSDNNISVINFSNEFANDIINSFDNSIIYIINDLIDMANEDKKISFTNKKNTRKLYK